MVEEETENIENEEDKRGSLTIQDFMNDMRILDSQLKSGDLVKPAFNIGDPTITNFLFWLVLGELMMLNDNIEE